MSSLDLEVIVQASQTISNEVRVYLFCFLFWLFTVLQVDFNTLVIKMVKAIVEHANAQRGTFFLGEEEPSGKVQLWVCAEYYQLRCALILFFKLKYNKF